MNARQRKFIEEQRKPLPPLDQTLSELELLACKRYETKARSKNAIEQSHRALHEILQTLNSHAKYPDLIAPTTVDLVHRTIRRRLKMDPKPPKNPSTRETP